jgi:hypothetical protein
VLAFARTLPGQPDEIAIVALNPGNTPVDVRIPTGVLVRDGVAFDPALVPSIPLSTENGSLSVHLDAVGAAVLYARAGQDLRGPDAPRAVSAIASPAGIELSWEGRVTAAAYEVGRAVLPGGEPSAVGSSEEPAFTDPEPGESEGVRYYRVRSLDAAGDKGPWSEEVRVQLPTTPGPTTPGEPGPAGTGLAVLLVVAAVAAVLIAARLALRRRHVSP